jgi:hypothetical protein
MYLDASSRGLWIREPDADDARFFLVIKDDICDLSEFGAFFADIFLDVKDSCRVLLCIVSSEQWG